MGVMSRRVIPACANVCFFCPSLRASSRQPVKRYKKLLADIFPRRQDAEPNDRKIGKLCEYASKNPLRIPKITDSLEQKFYKDLRNQHFVPVKAVLLVYRKLLSSCKEQMPFFSSSLLGIVRTLLEQTQHDDMQILGCNTFVDFINNQKNNTYMFNLEGLIPKLCQLAREVGDDERALQLRSAGMQALAVMVLFMGEQSHISMHFDIIITATLENYMDVLLNSENSNEDNKDSQPGHWVQRVLKADDHGSSFPNVSKKISSLPELVNSKSELVSTIDISKSSSHWSRVCLHNMAQLAKEATSIRRVLEPLFRSFDAENYWVPEKGPGYSMLAYLQSRLEESGDISHQLLSILVKHLDHKDVKRPDIQKNIINVVIQLAHNAKQQASVPIIGAISELIKRLRKCMQNSAEGSSSGETLEKSNTDLQSALENCIVELSNKVGDRGPILEMMAVVLENIPTGAVAARATMTAVHRAAQLISSVPNISYYKKAFPDALFHNLLLAMAHRDHETRIWAHCICCAVLIPCNIYPWSVCNGKPLDAHLGQLQMTQKVKSGSFSIHNESGDRPEFMNGQPPEKETKLSDQAEKYPSCGQLCSMKGGLSGGKTDLTSLRLSCHQINLLLSSIWVQAASTENTPANFVAMAHTYNIALFFTLSKSSSHATLVQCFQLAFSLRIISLDREGGLQPSRRRSLFTLASYMLMLSARASGLPDLIPLIKSSLTDQTIDPRLMLVEDIRLQAVCLLPGREGKGCGGSEEDEVAALKSFSAIKYSDNELKETVITHFMTKFGTLSEDDLLNMTKELTQGFSLDDTYPLGAPFFMETPLSCSPLAQIEFPSLHELMAPVDLFDEEAFPDLNGNRLGHETSLSINSIDVLNVNQLLESVLETAQQFASFPASSAPISYDQVKNQCEALVSSKQQKMSVLHSFKLEHEAKATLLSSETDERNSMLPITMVVCEEDKKSTTMELTRGSYQLPCSLKHGQYQSFRLPPSSPYDNFFKAAGG